MIIVSRLCGNPLCLDLPPRWQYVAMGLDSITIGALGTSRNDLDEAAVVAARAFYSDPFFEHLEPRPLLRARAVALFFRAAVEALGPERRALGATDREGRLVGVAAWAPPGTYPPPVRAQLRELASALRAFAPRPRALVDGSKYLLAIDRAHPKDELWYLLLLVADPSRQRGGIGTALQQPILDEADERGLDCYLETQREDNLAYYGRFGYQVVRVLHPVKTGPPLWTMRRSAR
jgi:GNAT superfamily N-acetyltransferase